MVGMFAFDVVLAVVVDQPGLQELEAVAEIVAVVANVKDAVAVVVEPLFFVELELD